MSNRTERVAFYTDPETKRQLEKDADRSDTTLSTHVHGLVEQQLEADTREQRYRELNAEERLESLVADIKDMQARMGVYAIANFELLKQDHPDTVRQQALSTGSRRLRDPDLPAADRDDSADDTDTDDPDPDDVVEQGGGNIFDELRDRDE